MYDKSHGGGRAACLFIWQVGRAVFEVMSSVARQVVYFIVSGIFAIIVGLVVMAGLGALLGAVYGEDSGGYILAVVLPGAVVTLLGWWLVFAAIRKK